jgi:hypothetical protein
MPAEASRPGRAGEADRFARLSVTTQGGETLAVPIPDEYRRPVDRARLLPWAPATAALAADLLRQGMGEVGEPVARWVVRQHRGSG